MSCYEALVANDTNHRIILSHKNMVISLQPGESRCIDPGNGMRMDINPAGEYEVLVSSRLISHARIYMTHKILSLYSTDYDTIHNTRRYVPPPLGGPGDGPTRSIDHMKINALILGDSTQTTIGPEGPSEYSTTTNDTSTPFSAIFKDIVTRVQVLGRSEDNAFYASMLVRRQGDMYHTEIIDQHSTPNLTLTIDTGDDRLFMLETNVTREWSVHTVIS